MLLARKLNNFTLQVAQLLLVLFDSYLLILSPSCIEKHLAQEKPPRMLCSTGAPKISV